jgi:Na+/H+-dicarboxylate symporter
LVVSSIILAVAGIAQTRGFGRLGLKTVVYFLVSTTAAILVGLALVQLFDPGVDSTGQGILVGRDLAAFDADQSVIESRTAGRGLADFLDVFRSMVPPNVIEAAAQGQLLGLITVSLLVGIFLAHYQGDARSVLERLVQGVYDITLRITDVVLLLAPIGVVGLLGATVAEQYAKLRPDGRFAEFGFEIFKFGLITFAALAIHMFLVLPLFMLVMRVNPRRVFEAMAPALATAFSTASSSATLPVTMDCVERRAGVSNRVAGFVLPLGATVNMNGTALYECVAAIFICKAFGIELSFAQQFMIVVIALLTSIGVAGVPAASLVAIVVILNAVQGQLPEGSPALIAGMGLLFVFDRPLDMCRTALNIFSDAVGSIVIARTEGERVAEAQS